MTDLYYRPHLREIPGLLPFSAQTPDGQWRTDLANNPESVAECGFVLAPLRPDDTESHYVSWNPDVESWELIRRPPPPPPPPPPPVFLTVGQFVSRFVVPDEEDAFGEVDDLMMAESRLVRRNWQNDRFEFREGDGFWTILRGHVESVLPGRVSELFASWSGSANYSATATDDPSVA